MPTARTCRPPILRFIDLRLLLLPAALLLAWGQVLAANPSRRPERARQGMVVSAQPLASKVGVEILKRGGNAVDAAIATGFALAVVYPAAGNLGGGGFMTVSLAPPGQDFTLDFRETAPGLAHREMYLDASGEVIKNLSTSSHLASGVPGTVAGLHRAWQQWGSLPWPELLQPAVELAQTGFPVSEVLARSLRSAEAALSRHPETRRLFLAGGNFLKEGDILQQPELAASLRRIAESGPGGFYRGRTAQLIVDEMRRGNGLISLDDLAGYLPKQREPVRGEYRGLEVISMGPPSSGGVLLVQMLNMLEQYSPGAPGFGSAEELHLKAELMKLAFADRAAYFGDPDFGVLPVPLLVSRDYARMRADGIRAHTAAVDVRPGPVTNLGMESEETTHYSVMDRDGTAVAVTTTLNGSYGSGVTVTGAGFLLNNEMDDFTVREGTPNMFGLVQSRLNLVEAGKRPLSAMTPTIVRRAGRPFLVLGSPGGPAIINTVFQVLVNVVDHQMPLQQAVDAPRIHHQWFPDELAYEQGSLTPDVEKSLAAKGHLLRERSRIGEAQCILFDETTGWIWGAADPRGEGAASGY